MKAILVAIFIFCLAPTFSQVTNTDVDKELTSLKQQINSLRNENNSLRNSINKIHDSLTLNNTRYFDLKKEVENNNAGIISTRQELGLKIEKTEKTSDQKFSEVNESLSKSTLYWIIGFLATALLVGIVYFLLGKRIKTDKSDVEDQISKTKLALEEEAIKLDTKLTEVLETQLKIVQAERKGSSNSIPNEEADHSLALKVADEIMRINKNLSNMDGNTKGLKQLAASVKRIEDNFAANGYEMPELLNKPFDSRMKLIVANSIPDENLKNGEEIITRIIKPQVNYKGVMIQAAQVEVSVGQ